MQNATPELCWTSPSEVYCLWMWQLPHRRLVSMETQLQASPLRGYVSPMYVWKSWMFWTVTMVVSILGPTNVVGSTSSYSTLCGGVPLSICAMASRGQGHSLSSTTILGRRAAETWLSWKEAEDKKLHANWCGGKHQDSVGYPLARCAAYGCSNCHAVAWWAWRLSYRPSL